MSQKLFLIIAIAVSLLSGCASFDGVVNNVQTMLLPQKITASPVQICQDFKENKVRANDAYSGKMLTASGTVKSIDAYGFTLNVQNVSVFNRTDDREALKKLSVGKPASVTGSVSSVEGFVGNCMIVIRNGTF